MSNDVSFSAIDMKSSKTRSIIDGPPIDDALNRGNSLNHIDKGLNQKLSHSPLRSQRRLLRADQSFIDKRISNFTPKDIQLDYKAHGLFKFRCKNENKHYFPNDPPALLWGFLRHDAENRPLFFTLIVKQKNQRKRHSQLLWWQYINALNSEITIPRTLFFVDSDVRFHSDGLAQMILGFKSLTVGAVCGEVRVDIQNKLNPLEQAQIFEYYVNHHLDKFNENAFSSVECLPGAFCGIKTQAFRYVMSRSLGGVYYDSSVGILNHLQANCVETGEDRFLTTLLIASGYLTNFCPKAISYTLVPTTIGDFINQRRRWVNSTIANLILLSRNSASTIEPGSYGSRYNSVSELIESNHPPVHDQENPIDDENFDTPVPAIIPSTPESGDTPLNNI